MRHTLRCKGAAFAAFLLTSAVCSHALAAENFGPLGTTLPANGPVPKVIVISLDGATPTLIENYLATKALPKNTGLGTLRDHGSRAVTNVTETPSLTAVSHLSIATGSTSVHNNVPSNTFHPVAAPITATLSGFGAPIGGYSLSPLGPTPTPTAKPLWLSLRDAGRKVVTATWPGGDGADIRINNVLTQAAVPTRTVDYTVPFGAFGGLGAQGFTLSAANFGPDAAIESQLADAGHASFSPVQVTTVPFETVFCAPATTAT